MIKKTMSEWEQQAVHHQDDLCHMVARYTTEEGFRAMVEDIRAKLCLEKANQLLDVGCGNGWVLSHLKQYVSHVTGVDFSRKMIDTAKALMPDGDFHQSEAMDLHFSDDSFDRVLCYGVFQYYPNVRYAERCIKELLRVCKSGGCLLLGDIPSIQYKRKCISLRGEIRLRLMECLGRSRIPSIHRPTCWMFYDLESLARFLELRGHSADILAQPENLVAASYRFDIRVAVSK
jgi:ubiquinone/menaquinone biosynthesis C-methylase UbiE